MADLLVRVEGAREGGLGGRGGGIDIILLWEWIECASEVVCLLSMSVLRVLCCALEENTKEGRACRKRALVGIGKLWAVLIFSCWIDQRSGIWVMIGIQDTVE